MVRKTLVLVVVVLATFFSNMAFAETEIKEVTLTSKDKGLGAEDLATSYGMTLKEFYALNRNVAKRRGHALWIGETYKVVAKIAPVQTNNVVNAVQIEDVSSVEVAPAALPMENSSLSSMPTVIPIAVMEREAAALWGPIPYDMDAVLAAELTEPELSANEITALATEESEPALLANVQEQILNELAQFETPVEQMLQGQTVPEKTDAASLQGQIAVSVSEEASLKIPPATSIVLKDGRETKEVLPNKSRNYFLLYIYGCMLAFFYFASKGKLLTHNFSQRLILRKYDPKGRMLLSTENIPVQIVVLPSEGESFVESRPEQELLLKSVAIVFHFIKFYMKAKEWIRKEIQLNVGANPLVYESNDNATANP